MAKRDNSFTVNIIPHDAARSRREFIISGKKLVLFRLIAVFLLFAILGSVVILSVGAAELTRTAELREENRVIADSLSGAQELNRRLDSIELELQEIRDTRTIIENLATTGISGDEPE